MPDNNKGKVYTFKDLKPVNPDPIFSGPMNVPLERYSNKYDEYFRRGDVQEYNRAANQSGLEQLGYGLVSRSLSIIPKTLGGLASVGSVLTADKLSDI